jgi:hypothetical protein
VRAVCVFGADFCFAPAELRLLRPLLLWVTPAAGGGGSTTFGDGARVCFSYGVLAELRIGIYNLGEAPEEKHKSREEAATSDWQEIALSGSHFIAHSRSHSHETRDTYQVVYAVSY